MKQFIKNVMWFFALTLALHHSWVIAKNDTPQAVIKNTVDQVLKNPDKLNDSAWVDHLVDQVFDFERMSRFVLGQNWKKANAQQQADFIKEFRALLIRTYSTSLKKPIAAGKTFEVNYLPSAGSRERPKIKTLVKETGKAPMAVDYDMYLAKDSWKAYNVTVEGVSLVTNYQNEFDKDVRTIGMDGLINKIRNQNLNPQNQTSDTK
jgi:phospholipid transport system substrate-binding protein